MTLHTHRRTDRQTNDTVMTSKFSLRLFFSYQPSSKLPTVPAMINIVLKLSRTTGWLLTDKEQIRSVYIAGKAL